MLKIKTDKTSEKVIKDPKCVEAGRQGRQKCMNDLNERTLNDPKKGSRDTTNTSNETTSLTTNATTKK